MKNKPENSRRNFLKKGVLATVAASTGVTASNAHSKQSSNAKIGTPQKPFNPKTFENMPTRAFGKTGYKVGILSLGGQAAIEKPNNEELSEKIINKSLDLGINYIDTAWWYGGGISERNIGRVLEYRRGEVYLACKTPKRDYDGSMQVLEEELSRLKTDHINLWQLHNVKTQDDLDKIFAEDGAIKALKKAKREGIVSHIGITGHFEPLVLARALRQYDFDAILLAINAADPHYLSFKNYLLPEALKQGLGTISMKVATRGRMLSSWTPPPLDDQPARMRTPLSGTISIKEALSYNMSLPVSTTIIGVDNVTQIEENVKLAAEFNPLSHEEMAAIEVKTLPIVRQGLYFRRWDLGV